MISTAPCKINLGLNILSKRPDGFHELETLFYPAGWSDALEVIETGNKDFDLTFSGLSIPGSVEDNLCYKAWKLLANDHPIPKLQAHLHKIVPMGAGLGGGSSDAAFMLKLINKVANLGFSDQKLLEYAAQLGSDCAFFIENRPCWATGRGEILSPVNLSLKGYYLVIVMPDLKIGTAEAYSWIKPLVPHKSISEIIKLPIEQWQGKLINDFEAPVAERFPLIQTIKNELISQGALYASMSGSGAAVFGIFKDDKKFDFKNTVVWQGVCEG